MQVKIVGELTRDYLTSGKTYDVVESLADGQLVLILDDNGWETSLITELSEFKCAHLGPNAKAVFV